MNNRVRPSPNTKTLCPWYRFATNGLLLRKAHGRSRISSARCNALSAVAYPCALELRTAEPRRLVPLRRFAVIGAALIGEDGVRDVTTAVDVGSKSWPFDIRLRPWGFRPHIGLLPLSYIAGGDVRPVATNGLESGRFQGFCRFKRQSKEIRSLRPISSLLLRPWAAATHSRDPTWFRCSPCRPRRWLVSCAACK